MTAHLLLLAAAAHRHCPVYEGPLTCGVHGAQLRGNIGLGLAVIAGGFLWFWGCINAPAKPKKKGKR